MKRPSALLSIVLLALAAHAAPASPGLPILNDDYASARAAALERHVPLFIEAWAPW